MKRFELYKNDLSELALEYRRVMHQKNFILFNSETIWPEMMGETESLWE